jgi:serine/threonine protein kinase
MVISYSNLMKVFDFSDFGLSRNLSKEKGEDLTEYVVTRFYRAPEVVLGLSYN